MALLIGTKKKLQKIDEYMTTIMSYMKKYNNDDKNKVIRALGNYAFKYDLGQNFLYLYIGDEVVLMKLNKDFTKFSSSAKKYKTEEQIMAIEYQFELLMPSIENTIKEATPIGIAENLTDTIASILDKIAKSNSAKKEIKTIPIDEELSIEIKDIHTAHIEKSKNDIIVFVYNSNLKINKIVFNQNNINKNFCNDLDKKIQQAKVCEMIDFYIKSLEIITELSDKCKSSIISKYSNSPTNQKLIVDYDKSRTKKSFILTLNGNEIFWRSHVVSNKLLTFSVENNKLPKEYKYEYYQKMFTELKEIESELNEYLETAYSLG